MIFKPQQETAEEDNAATATNNQFAALENWLNPGELITEVTKLPHFSQLKVCKTYEFEEVKKWAMNGWNTERILNLTATSLSDEAIQCALQWGFPQAYYSVYALTLAYFKVAGFTEQRHTAVIKKFGILAEEKSIPRDLVFRLWLEANFFCRSSSRQFI